MLLSMLLLLLMPSLPLPLETLPLRCSPHPAVLTVLHCSHFLVPQLEALCIELLQLHL
jgi:hypothetical protein